MIQLFTSCRPQKREENAAVMLQCLRLPLASLNPAPSVTVFSWGLSRFLRRAVVSVGDAETSLQSRHSRFDVDSSVKAAEAAVTGHTDYNS